jgi:hypothetical protein
MVFVETNCFKPEEAQHCAAHLVHLPVATSDSAKLIAAALADLTSIWRDGYRYKKAGVVLLDLHPAAARPGRTVRQGGQPAPCHADAHDRQAQPSLRPRYAVLRGRRSAGSAMEVAPGTSVTLLYNGVG